MTAAAIPCPLCGTDYDEAQGRACRSGCPFQAGCRLLRCPHCGYEIPVPGRLTRWLMRWLDRRAGREGVR